MGHDGSVMKVCGEPMAMMNLILRTAVLKRRGGAQTARGQRGGLRRIALWGSSNFQKVR